MPVPIWVAEFLPGIIICLAASHICHAINHRSSAKLVERAMTFGTEMLHSSRRLGPHKERRACLVRHIFLDMLSREPRDLGDKVSLPGLGCRTT